MKTKKTTPYSSIRQAKLANPAIAAEYLNEARAESLEALLRALLNVAQAQQITKVAKDAGVQRETLYRSFSDQGNPTILTYDSVLAAMGIDYQFVPASTKAEVSASPVSGSAKIVIQGEIGRVSANKGIQTIGSVFQINQPNAVMYWGTYSDTITADLDYRKPPTVPFEVIGNVNGATGERYSCPTKR